MHVYYQFQLAKKNRLALQKELESLETRLEEGQIILFRSLVNEKISLESRERQEKLEQYSEKKKQEISGWFKFLKKKTEEGDEKEENLEVNFITIPLSRSSGKTNLFQPDRHLFWRP